MLNHQALSRTTTCYTTMKEHIATFDFGSGRALEIPLAHEDEFQSAHVYIDGIPYHLERVPNSVLGSQYIVDNDPDYAPKSDRDGFCYMIAPFSE